MRAVNTVIFATLALGFAGGAVSAADPITIATSSNAQMPIHDSEPTDWSGFYAGLYGAVQSGQISGNQLGLGINAGVNAQFDFYLLGAEVAVSGLADNGAGETSYGQILARAGLVLTEDVLLYTAGGYGIDLGHVAEEDVLLGGGVELAVTDSMSVRAQYLHSFPTVGGNPKDQFAIGANFHF